eukprot:8432283-Pyramimonas_sp.AAC.1
MVRGRDRGRQLTREGAACQRLDGPALPIQKMAVDGASEGDGADVEVAVLMSRNAAPRKRRSACAPAS